MGSLLQIPLAQGLECRHLLDVVRVEVLQLQAVLLEHDSDESSRRDRGAPFVEQHEPDHDPDGGWGWASGPGTLHSSAAVSSDSMPSEARRSSSAQVKDEGDQFDISSAAWMATLA